MIRIKSFEALKAHAEKQGVTLNGFITRAIDETIKRDSSSEPGTTETEDDISAIQAARREYENGETVSHNAISWD